MERPTHAELKLVVSSPTENNTDTLQNVSKHSACGSKKTTLPIESASVLSGVALRLHTFPKLPFPITFKKSKSVGLAL